MKQLFSVLLILVFSACSLNKGAVDPSLAELPDDLKAFLHAFENAALSHDAERMLTLMDEEYLKVQHDEMLKGRTEQFLNELFCGNIVNSNSFKCLEFKNLKNLKLIKLENNTDSYTVYYIVKAENVSVTAEWEVRVKATENGRVFGIFGALG
jgi:hypothetical protein